MSPSVFLSHSADDMLAASQIREALKAVGIAVVSVADVATPGEFWAIALRDAVAEASAVIPLISTSYWGTQSSLTEISAAIVAGKPIMPVILDLATVPPILRPYVSIDASRLTSHRAIGDEIARALEISQHAGAGKSPSLPARTDLEASRILKDVERFTDLLRVKRTGVFPLWTTLATAVSSAAAIGALWSRTIESSWVGAFISASVALTASAAGYYFGKFKHTDIARHGSEDIES
jgi:hypothetical protein